MRVGLRIQDRHLSEGRELHQGGRKVQRRQRLLPRHALQKRRVHGADLLEEVQRLQVLQRTEEGLRSRAGSSRVSLNGCFGREQQHGEHGHGPFTLKTVRSADVC